MNNTSDFAGVENQLQYLTSQGASVRLVGAADGNYDSHNAQLATLAEQYGVEFTGGFTPGTDGVHPPNYQYGDLYAQVSYVDGNDDHDHHAEMPHDGHGNSDMITGVLSAFGTIIDDDQPEASIPPGEEPPAETPTDPVDPPVNENPVDETPVNETPADPPASDTAVQVSDIEIIEGNSAVLSGDLYCDTDFSRRTVDGELCHRR